jgi:hypothetical protein
MRWMITLVATAGLFMFVCAMCETGDLKRAGRRVLVDKEFDTRSTALGTRGVQVEGPKGEVRVRIYGGDKERNDNEK